MTHTIPGWECSAGVTQEDWLLSVADKDVALLMYALLEDEDLEEVFGEFLLPHPRSRVEA
jgi:hypothetical protein